jgi:hypothetical protein
LDEININLKQWRPIMANTFNKQEIVLYDEALEKFNDALVLSELVTNYSFGDQELERANDVIWRPKPYISNSYTGIDQSGNFGDSVQLVVPASVGTVQSANFTLTATELRDGTQESRLMDSKAKKLASDINVALMNTAAAEGTAVVPIATAATGYDDVALADAIFNERGVPMGDRYMALSTRDYNGMAGNLAERQTMNDMPTKAYRDSYVGRVAGFETHKLDYANRIAAALGTTVTINAATIGDRHYTPVSTIASGNGYNRTNVDNRYQTITIGVVSGTVAVGDAFTIAGVNSVHNITKGDTGELMTFRVHEILTGAGGAGTISISPPIITADDTTTAADVQYQNCSATPANGAALTFLNIAETSINPFWHKGAIELNPSRLVLPDNSNLRQVYTTTDQGVTLLMTSDSAIATLQTQYRFDVFFGTTMLEPEMAGIMLFGQT